MPESALNQMPAAHNHRDAPPGTAVKYGNGEIETIERLVDIRSRSSRMDTQSNSISATETIITDDNNRYRLTYPRVPNSREWIVPMQAMEDLSRLRQDHPLRRN